VPGGLGEEGGDREAKEEVLACHSIDPRAVSDAACNGPSLRIPRGRLRKLRTWSTLFGSGENDRKIAAPLARKDGSHPMHRATKECVSSPRVTLL
jgi:hypothetical protein